MKNKFSEILCKMSVPAALGAKSGGWDWVRLSREFSPVRPGDWCENGLSGFRPMESSIVSAMLRWRCGWIWLGPDGGNCGEHKYADQAANIPHAAEGAWRSGAESTLPGLEQSIFGEAVSDLCAFGAPGLFIIS